MPAWCSGDDSNQYLISKSISDFCISRTERVGGGIEIIYKYLSDAQFYEYLQFEFYLLSHKVCDNYPNELAINFPCYQLIFYNLRGEGFQQVCQLQDEHL